MTPLLSLQPLGPRLPRTAQAGQNIVICQSPSHTPFGKRPAVLAQVLGCTQPPAIGNVADRVDIVAACQGLTSRPANQRARRGLIVVLTLTSRRCFRLCS
jgi:hypothetical protein